MSAVHSRVGLDLGQLADLVLGVESTASLLSAVEDILTTLGAMPARMYLWDAHGGCYYAAAGFGCPREAADVLPIEPAPNRNPPMCAQCAIPLAPASRADANCMPSHSGITR